MTNINYQAYGDQQFTGLADLATFGLSSSPGIVVGVASSTALQCKSLDYIIDGVCPALTCASAVFGYLGIMVVDFDSELGSGFKVVNAAYQALSGQCGNLQRC